MQTQADFGGAGFINAQLFQRFQYIEIGFAGGDDAQLGIRAVDHRAVEFVGSGVGDGGVDFIVLHQRFLLARLHTERVGREARVQAAFGHLHIVGIDDLQAKRIGVDRGGGFDRICQCFETDGAAGVA